MFTLVTDVGFVTFSWFFDLNQLEVFILVEDEWVDALTLAKYDFFLYYISFFLVSLSLSDMKCRYYQAQNFNIFMGQVGDVTSAKGQVNVSFITGGLWQVNGNFTYCNPSHGCEQFDGTITTINPYGY